MFKQTFKKIIVAILQFEARLVLKKYKPKIVAVTGSVGKTSTKDAIYTVLASSFFVRKSSRSLNSDMGVPLTILGCPNGWNNPLTWIKNIFEGIALIIFPNRYPTWLVLEVGTDRPGDIRDIAEWLKPDVVVVTKLSKTPVHVEFFDSPEALFEEKGYLVKALKRDGVLVLNGDDEDVLAYKQVGNHKTILFGIHNEAAVVGSNYHIVYESQEGIKAPTGITFKVDYAGNSIPVSIQGSVGRHLIYPILAGIAVGISQNINMVAMAEALSEHVPPPGRMRIMQGLKDTTIIDDSYNASPVAMYEALETLKELKTTGRKIAVLGDMMELGKYSTDEHKNTGKIATGICDILITVGVRSRFIAESALDNGLGDENIIQFEDSQKAGKQLEILLQKGDIVLVKGSQSVRMERVVEEVMAHPENKEVILVRQEPEWQVR